VPPEVGGTCSPLATPTRFATARDAVTDPTVLLCYYRRVSNAAKLVEFEGGNCLASG
jgi:hypothetical protein